MSTEPELLRAFLASADAECDACGHGLRGITLSKCPECGRELRLKVRAQKHTLAPWVTAMLAVSLAAGFDGILAIVMIGAVLYHWNNPPPGYFFGIILGFALTAGGLLAAIGVIARRRRAWWREDAGRQWRWAASVAGVVFAIHAGAGLWLGMRL